MTWKEIPERVKQIMIAERKAQKGEVDCSEKEFIYKGTDGEITYLGGFDWDKCSLGDPDTNRFQYGLAWARILGLWANGDLSLWEKIYGKISTNQEIEQDGIKFIV